MKHTIKHIQKKYPVLSQVFFFFFIIAIPAVLLKISGKDVFNNPFATVYASTSTTGTLGTDGQINSIISDTSGGVYIGGTFTYIGSYTGDGIPVTTASGSTTVYSFPKVNGTINSVVPDSSNGWYIGGAFTQVGTTARTDIAHILSNGTVDQTFNPNPNGTVTTLALATSTNTLYVGGTFSNIAGTIQNFIAAVNSVSGNIVSSFSESADAALGTLALSPDGSKLYLGGSFTQLGPTVGSGVPVATTTGSTTSPFPKVNSTISAVVQDGSNGWYIGGAFTIVGGITRNRIAHILSDGTVDPNFDPNANSTVNTLALSTSTNTLYLGGIFTTMGGTTRNRVAAVSTTNGSLVSTFDPNVNNTVNRILLSLDGSRLYIGGGFTSVGGVSRTNIAAVNTSDGSIVTSFSKDTDGALTSLALSPDGNTLYIGGGFTSVGALFTSGATISTSTGFATNPNIAKVNSDVDAVLSDGANGWYIGGAFTTVGGVARSRLAHILSDGSLDQNFNPNVNSTINSLVLSTSTNTLYLGGLFTTVGGVARNRVAAVSTVDGSLVSTFDPNANNAVSSLALSTSSNILYIGGTFTTVGGVVRNRVAAVSTVDGSLVSTFDPNANNIVNAIALSPDSSTLYLGGTFTTLGTTTASTTRNRIAAVNTSDGSLVSAFNPNADNSVNGLTLSPDGSKLYVGGTFINISGAVHGRAVTLNTSTGSSTTPNLGSDGLVDVITLSADGSTLYMGGRFGAPAPYNITAIKTSDSTGLGGLFTGFQPAVTQSGTVKAIAVSTDGNSIYVGGAISTIGGTNRFVVAGLSTSDASVNPFNPSPNGTVSDITVSPDGTKVYLGGAFAFLNGTGHARIGAVNASDGSAISAFNPNPNNSVTTLALSSDGSKLYFGGTFTAIGATTRNRIAGVNVSDGSLITTFDPNANNNVNTIALSTDKNSLYLGGIFNLVGSVNRNHVAALNTSDGSLVSAFNPNVNNIVNTITLSTSSNILYIGGTFTTIGGTTRNALGAVNTSDGSLVTAFTPNATTSISSIVLSPFSNILYFGGSFTTVNGVTRNRIAGVNTSDGSLVSTFNPNANNSISTLALSPDGNTLYLGGAFTSVASTTSYRITAVNVSDGSLVSTFNPNANSTINTIALSADGSTLYLGGAFTSVGGIPRSFVAHLLSNGSVDTNFNANVGGAAGVSTLVLSPDGNTLYLGGNFTLIGTSTRNRVAAVNAMSGSFISGFDVNANSTVSTLALSPDGNTLYLGGTFTLVATSTTRNRIAGVNVSDGSLITTFDPNANNTVSALILSSDGSKLYIGGSFSTIVSTARASIAAVNTSDGSLVSTFNPNANSSVLGLALSPDGNTLYIGGSFTTVGGLAINRLAKVNISDGSLVTAFNPNVNSTIQTMLLSSSTNTIYLGGSFTTVDGVTRNRIAAVNTANGSLVTSFDPNANSTVIALSPTSNGNTLYIGGAFGTIGGLIYQTLISVPGIIFSIASHHTLSAGYFATSTATTSSDTAVAPTPSSGTATTSTTTQTISTSTPVVTPVVNAPAMPPFSFTQILKLGSSGDEVKQLQIFLNTHGYPVAKSGTGSLGHETSYFGGATEKALIQFQNAHVNDILAPQNLSSGTGIFWLYSKKVMNLIISGK